jgi:hypothetical protein
MLSVDAQLDYKNLRQKNEELGQSLREKARKHAQTQELYDKLKRRAMLGQVQNAASEAVDHTIQASVTADGFVDRVGNMNQPQYRSPLFPSAQKHSTLQPLPGNGHTNVLNAGWPGFGSQESNRRKYEEFLASFVNLTLVQRATILRPRVTGNVLVQAPTLELVLVAFKVDAIQVSNYLNFVHPPGQLSLTSTPTLLAVVAALLAMG